MRHLIFTTCILLQPCISVGQTVRSEAANLISAGQASSAAHDYSTARRKFADAVAMDPHAAAVVCPELGAISFAQGRYEQAVKELRSCPDQEDVRTRDLLGQSLYRAGATSEGVAMLERTVKDDPTSFAAALQLARHYEKIDPSKAITEFQTYLHCERRPRLLDREVNRKLGYLFLVTKRWDDARLQFEALLRESPSDTQSKVSLGTAYVGLSQWDRAVGIYEPILSEAQRQPSIFINLTRSYLRLGKRADAERIATMYLHALPNDKAATELLREARSSTP